MTRAEALAALRVAGWHTDSYARSQVMLAARVSTAAANKAYDEGERAAEAGKPCPCALCAELARPKPLGKCDRCRQRKPLAYGIHCAECYWAMWT